MEWQTIWSLYKIDFGRVLLIYGCVGAMWLMMGLLIKITKTSTFSTKIPRNEKVNKHQPSSPEIPVCHI